jgi:hypothetical protein
MDRKCLIYTEKWWRIDQAGLLTSYWLAAFSCVFFTFTQPLRKAQQEMGPVDILLLNYPNCLHYFIGIVNKVSPTLFGLFLKSCRYPSGAAQLVSYIEFSSISQASS